VTWHLVTNAEVVMAFVPVRIVIEAKSACRDGPDRSGLNKGQRRCQSATRWTLFPCCGTFYAMEILTLEEIHSRFASEWVLVGDPELTESLVVIRGTVLWHSPNRDEVYRKAHELRPRHSAILYTGTLPDETAVVLWLLRSPPLSRLATPYRQARPSTAFWDSTSCVATDSSWTFGLPP